MGSGYMKTNESFGIKNKFKRNHLIFKDRFQSNIMCISCLYHEFGSVFFMC